MKGLAPRCGEPADLMPMALFTLPNTLPTLSTTPFGSSRCQRLLCRNWLVMHTPVMSALARLVVDFRPAPPERRAFLREPLSLPPSPPSSSSSPSSLPRARLEGAPMRTWCASSASAADAWYTALRSRSMVAQTPAKCYLSMPRRVVEPSGSVMSGSALISALCAGSAMYST